MDQHRAERVSEAVREELSELIGYEMSDPRLSPVDVAEVHLDPDMRHARVIVAVSGGEQARQQAMEALEGARHYMRRELAARLRLYRMPELRFEAAAGPETASRLDILLHRVRKDRRKSARNEEKSL